MRIMRHELDQARAQQFPEPHGRISTRDALWRIALAREAIEAAGSQRAMARAIGINQVQVSRWLHSVRPVPERWLMPMAVLIETTARELAS